MKELEKPTSSSSKTADDGAYGKRLSPRFHNNVAVHNAGLLLDGCSAQRRCSPRLHKNCPNIGRVSPLKPSSRGSFCPNFGESPPCYPVDSSPEPSVQGTFISKFRESLERCRPIATIKTITDSETQIPNFLSRDPSFQRRLSPRLNKNPDLSSSSLRQTQRRPSPRLHQTPEEDMSKELTLHRRLKPGLHSDGKNEKEKPKESAPQRRASPKIHSDAENEKQKPKESVPKRRVSPRLHSDGEYEKQKHKESAPQRRVSPRLHSDGENEKQKHKESALQRRVSPRLHAGGENEKQKLIPDGSASEKRSFSGFHTKDNFNNAKRSRHDHTKDDGCERSLKPSHSTGNGPAANNELPFELTVGSKVLKKKAKMDGIAPVAAGRSNHAMLKETLRIFNAYYLQFIKEEEEKRKKSKNEEKKSKALKSKEKDVKQTSSRPDLRALSKASMKEKKEILYPDKRIGHIPGIEVGYQFFSRAEMVAIGFHSPWLNGIDYIGQSATKTEEDRHYTFPIAVSIVMSGQYEDDLDNSEDIIYTGEGGHDLVGSKLQHADQVLLRGNLAMKNSMEQSVPVRVVRGHISASSYSGKIYTYDGLYKIRFDLACDI
ncbi:hypothetical protein Cgig2_028552 [Carnegiea gigantea]|uniref:YDG domain-containing protein n=1 Tax=Carnegiea gigantea TaxID=171969 RepID=A0A9Q1JWC4_9CARY|nr:hypothetical protein Cgig2_028552 [Carnegiea gigantea]